jgi:hypothetical protein
MNKNTLQSLDGLRMHYIDNLRISMQLLKDVATRCLKKIEEEGISGHYSGNSEVSRLTSQAWRASWALMELKHLEESISKEIDQKVEKKLEDLLECIRSSNNKKEIEE